MSFQNISYLELWRLFCSVEWNHLCNFCKRLLSGGNVITKYFLSRALAAPLFGGAEPFVQCRRHHEEQFCEIILNLDQWFRSAILVEGIMSNNFVKLF